MKGRFIMSTEKQVKAIELIGAEIETYGHFASYSIPDESGKGITNESLLSKEAFLDLVYEYFYSKRMNYDYFEDEKECQSVKSFVKKRVKDTSYQTGLEWVDSHTFLAS